MVFAADLPVKHAPTTADPVPLSWSGIYFGGNVGSVWGHSTADTALAASGFGFGSGPCAAGCSLSQSLAFHSAEGGMQLGYSHQFGIWVFGIEGDFQ